MTTGRDHRRQACDRKTILEATDNRLIPIPDWPRRKDRATFSHPCRSKPTRTMVSDNGPRSTPDLRQDRWRRACGIRGAMVGRLLNTGNPRQRKRNTHIIKCTISNRGRHTRVREGCHSHSINSTGHRPSQPLLTSPPVHTDLSAPRHCRVPATSVTLHRASILHSSRGNQVPSNCLQCRNLAFPFDRTVSTALNHLLRARDRGRRRLRTTSRATGARNRWLPRCDLLRARNVRPPLRCSCHHCLPSARRIHLLRPSRVRRVTIRPSARRRRQSAQEAHPDTSPARPYRSTQPLTTRAIEIGNTSEAGKRRLPSCSTVCGDCTRLVSFVTLQKISPYKPTGCIKK